MVYRGLTIVFALLLYFEQCGYCGGQECQQGECASSALGEDHYLRAYPLGDCYVNGTTVKFNCTDGTLEGSPSSRCINEEWTNDPPTCVYCSPPEIGNLTLEPNKMIYEVEEEVKFSCDAGYKLTGVSPRTAQCILNETGSATWNSTAGLECMAFNCPAPSSEDENLSWTDKGIDTYEGNAIITYECAKGYELEGNSPNECIDQDKWKFEDPECNSGRIDEAVRYFLLMTTFYSLISYYM